MPRYKNAAHQRWPFRHKLKNGTVKVYWLKVIPAWNTAHPILEAKHVQESIRRHGVADTQNCAEACMVQDNADKFDHPVEGTIDFTYRRVAVVSKLYKEPRILRGSKRTVSGECVVYEHKHSDIAKLNDSPRGQKKLLAMLKANGPLQQTFRALTVRPSRTWPLPKPGRRTLARTRFKRGKARAAFAIAALETPIT